MGWPWRRQVLARAKIFELTAQALIDARNHRDDYPGVYDFTTGIAFFGTPFRGAEGMQPAQLLEMARREYDPEKIDISVLETLDPDNQLTQKILDDFSLIRRAEHKTRIACFYESAPTNVGLIVGGKTQEVVRSNLSLGVFGSSNLQCSDMP